MCFCHHRNRRFLAVRGHLGGDLALGAELAALLGALQDALAVLVELELGDDDVGGVDAEGHALAGDLVASDALDVDDIFETIDGGDLALLALVAATDDHDLVILADGDAADLETKKCEHVCGRVVVREIYGETYVVLLAKLLAEGSAHDGAALAGGSLEVSRTALAARVGDLYKQLISQFSTSSPQLRTAMQRMFFRARNCSTYAC